MLPDNVLSSMKIESIFLSPDNRKRNNRRIDFELGPVALYNTTQGVMYQIWKAWTEDNNTKIYISPEDNLANSQLLITEPEGSNISEVSLTFDQLARPQLAYMVNGLAKLWWYDSSTSSQTLTEYPGITSPVITLDDKRSTSNAVNDIIFAYIKSSALYYRQQRDRYQIERHLANLSPNEKQINNIGLSTNNRLAISFIYQG